MSMIVDDNNNVGGCQAGSHASYQVGFFSIFTALVVAELILASLVDRFPKTEERDEVSLQVSRVKFGVCR